MKFTMDFMREYNLSFEGITFGKTWNGWECPSFTKKVADEIAAFLNQDTELFGHMEYHEQDGECFYTITHDDEEDNERYDGFEFNGTQYFSIGAFSWIWEEDNDMKYVICCNGNYDVVYGEYAMETYVNDLLDEGYSQYEIMVFDIDAQLK